MTPRINSAKLIIFFVIACLTLMVIIQLRHHFKYYEGYDGSGSFDGIGVFKLRDSGGGQCISVENSTDLKTMPCDISNTSQMMKFNPQDSNFKINNISSDKCLYHNSADKLGIDDCDNDFRDQSWQISQAAGTTTRLINLESGRCLTANQTGPMLMANCDDSNPAQQYHFDRQTL